MIWKLLLVAVTAFLVFRRSGLARNPWVRDLLRITPPRSRARSQPQPQPAPKESQAPRPWLSDRAFVVLALTAATAVAAWVVTRMTVIGTAGTGH